MPDTHQEITKVWIAPGCIVCDACENESPEVFDVQEETCIIRPPALKPDFLAPLTPTIVAAAEGCPVDVIKYETKEVPGPAPWTAEPQPAGAGAQKAEAAPTEARAHAPVAKKEVALGPPDPKMQALIGTSRISPSLSAPPGAAVKKSTEVIQAQEMIRAVNLPKNAPLDQRMALLAAGGAYAPAPSLAQRIRERAASIGKISRRRFNGVLAFAWAVMALCGAAFALMFQDFFGPKVLKEPKKLWRVGRQEDFAVPGLVDDRYKRTPDGGTGFWVVNLSPREEKLVAISTICTHLGCIPDWLTGDQKFKCPCHGSGYYIDGVNFEGPTPRPLERFAITKDPDGYIVVDQSKVYRQELGEWGNPESFVALS